MVGVGAQNVEKKGIGACLATEFVVGDAHEEVDFEDGDGVVDALDVFVDGLEDFENRRVSAPDVGIFGAHERVCVGKSLVAVGFIGFF